MSTAIVNNRIVGTRITVFHVYHYLEDGDWTPEEIASVLQLSLDQVQAAIRYIEDHKEEVLEVHREIEERNARGNPPEIRAQLEESHTRLLAWLEERRQARQQQDTKPQEANGEGNRSGR